MTRARDNSFNPFNNNYAGKNLVINGGFDIWQRGTSFVSPNAVYTTDRWSNDTAGMTISRQSSGAPSGSLYYLRTTSTASSAYTDFYHFFETANVSTLWGKTVTYSFKIRKSGTTPIGSFILTLQKSASVDGGRSSTWTTIVSSSTAFSNILTGTSSSDWTAVTATATIPNDGSANSLRFIGGFDNGQASGVVVDLAQVQLEVGSVATPFSRAGGTIGGELTLCQRYYYRAVSENLYGPLGVGKAYSVNNLNINVPFPVRMRATPSVSSGDVSALSTFQLETGGTAVTSPSSIGINGNIISSTFGAIDVVKASAFTAGAFYYLMGANNANAFVGFSAEI